jgi:hypothetical protein
MEAAYTLTACAELSLSYTALSSCIHAIGSIESDRVSIPLGRADFAAAQCALMQQQVHVDLSRRTSLFSLWALLTGCSLLLAFFSYF